MRKNKGSVIITVVIVFMILLSLGFSGLFSSSLQHRVSANIQDYEYASLAADAAMANAKAWLRSQSSAPSIGTSSGQCSSVWAYENDRDVSSDGCVYGPTLYQTSSSPKYVINQNFSGTDFENYHNELTYKITAIGYGQNSNVSITKSENYKVKNAIVSFINPNNTVTVKHNGSSVSGCTSISAATAGNPPNKCVVFDVQEGDTIELEGTKTTNYPAIIGDIKWNQEVYLTNPIYFSGSSDMQIIPHQFTDEYKSGTDYTHSSINDYSYWLWDKDRDASSYTITWTAPTSADSSNDYGFNQLRLYTKFQCNNKDSSARSIKLSCSILDVAYSERSPKTGTSNLKVRIVKAMYSDNIEKGSATTSFCDEDADNNNPNFSLSRNGNYWVDSGSEITAISSKCDGVSNECTLTDSDLSDTNSYLAVFYNCI